MPNNHYMNIKAVLRMMTMSSVANVKYNSDDIRNESQIMFLKLSAIFWITCTVSELDSFYFV